MEKEWIDVKTLFPQMGQQDNLYYALYRGIASDFGVASCEMWVYYFLFLESEGLTQQAISSRMVFPKQTVHSAVKKLMEQGMVEFIPDENNRKSRTLRLTAEGTAFAQSTVACLIEAEAKASRGLGKKKLSTLCKLRKEYYDLLEKEFRQIPIQNVERQQITNNTPL